jgi:putative glutamine amidotransferase
MLAEQYVRAVEAVGAVGVVISPAHGDLAIGHLVRLVDGLLLTGGEDIDPGRYGRARSGACEEPNPARDAMELDVLRMAEDVEMPVLAVCRGLQLLNVFHGGTLHQHLPTCRTGPVSHVQREPIGDSSHSVEIEPHSRLAGIVGDGHLRVNSFHHQGVDRIGEGLRVSARAEDGLVEAMEPVDGREIIAVQWHPERDRSAASGALFRWLADRAAAHARRGGGRRR